ncbi:MAG TPA: hypothetical protein VN457_05380, partial [Chlamydiales bacterium]|nr:hypothetical protein [Chlamydiales bacterium]
MNETTLLQWLAFLSLVALFFVSSFHQATRRLRKEVNAYCFLSPSPNLYFRIHKWLFGSKIDTLIFCTALAQNALRLSFAIVSIALFLGPTSALKHIVSGAWEDLSTALTFLLFVFFLMLSLFTAGDLLPRLWATFGAN